MNCFITNFTMLLILAGDIETNPGPKNQCGACKKLVKRTDNALCCDSCDHWVHIRCENIKMKDYKKMVESNNDEDWYCSNCNANCYLCNKQVKSLDPAVKCDNCNNWIHNNCSGIYTKGRI